MTERLGALVKATFNQTALTDEQRNRLVEALRAQACKGNGSWFKFHTNVIVAKITEVDYDAIIKMIAL